MNRYMLLTIGFEMPTQEIMARWQRWFESISERIVEQVGLRNGREINADGVRDLPMDADAITGYVIVEAGSLDEAESLARDNPFITSIRIYEVMTA